MVSELLAQDEDDKNAHYTNKIYVYAFGITLAYINIKYFAKPS